MLGITHVVVGASLGVVAAKSGLIPALPIAIVAIVAAAGSLLPDIDHPQSAFGRRVRILSIPISAVFGHRGITHSLLAVAAMSLALVFFAHGDGKTPVIAALALGYLSHLLADAMTVSGIPLLWPRKTVFRVPGTGFRTGGYAEVLVCAVAFGLAALSVTP